MTSEPLTSPNAEQPEQNAKRGRWFAWWLRPKIAFPLLFLLMLLLAPMLIRGYRLGRVPEAPEPFDTTAVLNLIVPDAQNAFVEYRQATASLIDLPGVESQHLDDALQGEWADATDGIRRWVEDNRGVIELWKQGSAKPDAQHTRAGELGIDTLMTDTQQIRMIGRLLQLEVKRLRSEGHPDKAWELLKVGLYSGQHIGRRGVALERLVGIAIGGVMSAEVVKWAGDPRVSVELLRHVQKEHDEVLRHQPPISSTLQLEYLYMRKTIQSPSLWDEIPILAAISSPVPGWGNLSLYTIAEPALCERSLNHLMRNYLSQVDKPHRKRTRQSGQHNCFDPDSTAAATVPTASQVNDWVDHSLLCREIVPLFPQFVIAADRVNVRDSLLRTVLALEIYRRENGTYPEKLEELVPDFIPEVPDDIFEPAPSPLKYRRDSANALLWSIGEDAIDNGGDIEDGKDRAYLLGPPKPKAEAPEASQ